MKSKIAEISIIKLVLAIINSLIIFSCATTSVEEVAELEPKEFTYDKSKNKIEGDKTYLYIRIYDPEYKNAFSAENFLKKLIGIVEVNEDKGFHCSIGFSLEDKFVGITSSKGDGINENINIEQCTDTSTNEYMASCDPKKSLQTTYGIEVSQKEFDDALALVNSYMNSEDADYSVGMNFLIAGKEFKRKFFTPKENQNIKNMKVKEGSFSDEERENKFICSSFVGYILQSTVGAFREFFEERQIDYNYLMPTDLVELPKVKKLFTSNWDDYEIAAEKYMKENW